MTALKQEVLQLIEQLPEEKISYVIQYIHELKILSKDTQELSPKIQAFQRLEKLRIHVPDDFDYEKELKEAREETYGYID